MTATCEAALRARRLVGDAAGVVAPASGEGIYYAMLGGRLAAEAALARLRQGVQRAGATFVLTGGIIKDLCILW